MVNSKPVYIGVFYRQPKLGVEPLRNNMSFCPKLVLPKIPSSGWVEILRYWLVHTLQETTCWMHLQRRDRIYSPWPYWWLFFTLATEVNHVHQTDVHQVLNILQLLLLTNPGAFPPVISDPGLADHFILLADPKLRTSIQKSSESTSSESLQVW